MDQQDWVAVLSIFGAALTAAGVIMAYLQARAQRRRLDRVAITNSLKDEVDLVEVYERALEGVPMDETAKRKNEAIGKAVEEQLVDAGVRDGLPTLEDLSLPAAYWARRSAVTDAVASFRTGGVVALVGLGRQEVQDRPNVRVGRLVDDRQVHQGQADHPGQAVDRRVQHRRPSPTYTVKVK